MSSSDYCVQYYEIVYFEKLEVLLAVESILHILISHPLFPCVPLHLLFQGLQILKS